MSPPWPPANVGLGRLQFPLHQFDDLLEHFQIFGPRDHPHLGEQAPSALEHFDALLHTESLEGAPWVLHFEQFVDFLGAELGGALLIAFQPRRQLGKCRTPSEHLQQGFVKGALAMHSGQ